ncbi:MAG: hypothetical protein Tsb0020_25360 [Haliangiales bacterium]
MLGRVAWLSIAVGLALIFICPTSETVADSPLRFQAGPTTASTDPTNAPGFLLGGSLALARWEPSAHFALTPQLELLYARRAASMLTGSTNGNSYAIDFIELPLLLRSELSISERRFYALAGGYGSILLSAQTTIDGFVQDAEIENQVDVGIVAAAGFELFSFGWGELFLEARYQRGYRALLAGHDDTHQAASLLLGYGLSSDINSTAGSRTIDQRLALKGGLVATRLSSSESAVSAYRPGYSFGGAFSLARLGSRLALVPQLELAFVRRSAHNGLPEDGSLALDSIDVATLIRGEVGTPNRAAYAVSGVYGSVLVRAQRSYNGAVTNMRDMVSPFDAGWLAGGGIELASATSTKLSVELRYQRGLRDLFQAQASTVTQQSVSCLLAITYGGGPGSSSAPPFVETGSGPLHSSNQPENAQNAQPKRRVNAVAIGRVGDRWVHMMRFMRIERGTRDGKNGYLVTYDVAGHGIVVLFWPRKDIDFDGRARAYRSKKQTLRKGRVIYPTRLNRESLPEVFRHVLTIEQAYAEQAKGGIEAMNGFAVVTGLGGVNPTLRATSIRAPSRASASNLGRNSTHQTSKASTATSTSSAAGSVAPSSRVLGEALEAAGHIRPPGAAAHHIVAGKAPAAADARAVLNKFNIGINNAINGVFLPATRASPNVTGTAVHSTLHTRKYYRYVNNALNSAKTRVQAEAILNRIREKLLSGGI